MFPNNQKKRDANRIFISLLLISTVICSMSLIRTCLANDTPKIFTDPAVSTFNAAPAGTQFNVSITVANITNLVGVEFKVYWNATLLNVTAFNENLFKTIVPEGEEGNIWQIKKVTNNTGGYIHYAFTFQSTQQAIDMGYAPINITTAEYSEGKLAAAILTFMVKQTPPANSMYESSLVFETVKMGDPLAGQIATSNVTGYYRNYGPPEVVNHTVSHGGANYTVTTTSNGTVVPGSATFLAGPPDWILGFNLTGTDNDTAYVNVTIPKNLLSLALVTDTWNVTINGVEVTPTVLSDTTNWYLYFTAGLSTKEVEIIGTVPELTMLLAVPALMVASLIAVALRRRRYS